MSEGTCVQAPPLHSPSSGRLFWGFLGLGRQAGRGTHRGKAREDRLACQVKQAPSSYHHRPCLRSALARLERSSNNESCCYVHRRCWSFSDGGGRCGLFILSAKAFPVPVSVPVPYLTSHCVQAQLGRPCPDPRPTSHVPRPTRQAHDQISTPSTWIPHHNLPTLTQHTLPPAASRRRRLLPTSPRLHSRPLMSFSPLDPLHRLAVV